MKQIISILSLLVLFSCSKETIEPLNPWENESFAYAEGTFLGKKMVFREGEDHWKLFGGQQFSYKSDLTLDRTALHLQLNRFVNGENQNPLALDIQTDYHTLTDSVYLHTVNTAKILNELTNSMQPGVQLWSRKTAEMPEEVSPFNEVLKGYSVSFVTEKGFVSSFYGPQDNMQFVLEKVKENKTGEYRGLVLTFSFSCNLYTSEGVFVGKLENVRAQMRLTK